MLAARQLLCRAGEALRLAAAGGGGGAAGRCGEDEAAVRVRWQEAKLQWAGGGAGAAEAVRLARALLEEAAGDAPPPHASFSSASPRTLFR